MEKKTKEILAKKKKEIPQYRQVVKGKIERVITRLDRII